MAGNWDEARGRRRSISGEQTFRVERQFDIVLEHGDGPEVFVIEGGRHTEREARFERAVRQGHPASMTACPCCKLELRNRWKSISKGIHVAMSSAEGCRL